MPDDKGENTTPIDNEQKGTANTEELAFSRSEAVKKWSIESGGYVAQTSLLGEDEPPEPYVERRGRKSSANITANISATKGELSQIIRHNVTLYKQPPCKNDEEIADRIEAYFTWCGEKGIVPTWEALALALGVTRATVWNWETGVGCSATRTALIRQAKQILNAVEAELAMTGKVQPVTYIFRAKAVFGYREQQDIVVSVNNPLGATVSADELAKRINEGVILDSSDFGIDFEEVPD